MSWDPFQREVLEALGHPPMRHSGPERPRLPDDPLLHALLRASGRRADAPDAHDLVDGWPDWRTLRGDAGAKRAIWPRLRALRAGGPRG